MTSWIVDSYAWVEYLDGSPLGRRVGDLLEAAEEAFTPTPVVAEVTSKAVRSGRDPEVAWKAMRSWSVVLPLDAESARAAGALHAMYRKRVPDFAMTDAVLVVFARKRRARIVTGDPHFRGMKGVEFLA